MKERRTRGADCCTAPPPLSHKANRRSRAPDAVMATVMQVAHRDLNLDKREEGGGRKKEKKKRRGMKYYYRVPREKYET